MACTCFYYDVIIDQIDLDDATGNTDPGKFDGTVYVDYIDCSGNSQQDLYTLSGTFLNDLCIDTTGSPAPNIYYYKNNTQIVGPSSSVSQTLTECCAAPVTPTPNPTPSQTPTNQTPTPTETSTPTETPTQTVTPSTTPPPDGCVCYQYANEGEPTGINSITYLDCNHVPQSINNVPLSPTVNYFCAILGSVTATVGLTIIQVDESFCGGCIEGLTPTPTPTQTLSAARQELINGNLNSRTGLVDAPISGLCKPGSTVSTLPLFPRNPGDDLYVLWGASTINYNVNTAVSNADFFAIGWFNNRDPLPATITITDAQWAQLNGKYLVVRTSYNYARFRGFEPYGYSSILCTP